LIRMKLRVSYAKMELPMGTNRTLTGIGVYRLFDYTWMVRIKCRSV
jgi:hypothetical protein